MPDIFPVIRKANLYGVASYLAYRVIRVQVQNFNQMLIKKFGISMKLKLFEPYPRRNMVDSLLRGPNFCEWQRFLQNEVGRLSLKQIILFYM